jgi:hypothetical protein
MVCEISSSHGGEYDVQSCLLGFTRQYNPEDSSEQEWFELARDDVLRLRRAPPLVSFLVAWLVNPVIVPRLTASQ